MANTDEDFVESIGEMISYFLDLRGVGESDCHALSAAVTEQIRERYQGERVTIRKSDQQRLERHQIRDKVRQARADGCTIKQIMERFNISRRTVFNYLQK